jgi:solute carrier family 25 carnitine/acylcarnitine transporter 20/29
MSCQTTEPVLGLNGFIGGLVSGAFQNIVTYPLDTLKVRYQNKIKPSIHNHFFSGLSSSTISTILCTSVGFGTNELFRNKVKSEYTSGFITGIFSTFVCTPLENLKIRHQLNLKSKFPLYRGLKITFLRETIGNSIYFGTYNDIILRQNKKNDLTIMLSGGIAGMLSWITTYHIDVVKTRIQSGSKLKEAIKQGHFIKGLGFCLSRAFIGNSIGFYVYEKIINR